jgi:hypothetical protein
MRAWRSPSSIEHLDTADARCTGSLYINSDDTIEGVLEDLSGKVAVVIGSGLSDPGVSGDADVTEERAGDIRAETVNFIRRRMAPSTQSATAKRTSGKAVGARPRKGDRVIGAGSCW